MRIDLLPTTLDGKISKTLEESGEVIHCIGKYQRHGEFATDPKTGLKYDNLSDLDGELHDLKDSIHILLEALNERRTINRDGYVPEQEAQRS